MPEQSKTDISHLLNQCFELRVKYIQAASRYEPEYKSSLEDDVFEQAIADIDFFLNEEINSEKCLEILDRLAYFANNLYIEAEKFPYLKAFFLKIALEIYRYFISSNFQVSHNNVLPKNLHELIKYVREKIGDKAEALYGFIVDADRLNHVLFIHQEKIKLLMKMAEMNIVEFFLSFDDQEDLRKFLQVFDQYDLRKMWNNSITSEEKIKLSKSLRNYIKCRYIHLVVNDRMVLDFKEYCQYDEDNALEKESYFAAIEKFFVRVFKSVNNKLMEPNELRDIWFGLPVSLQEECIQKENELQEFIKRVLADKNYGSEEYGIIPDILNLLNDFHDAEDRRQEVWSALRKSPSEAMEHIEQLSYLAKPSSVLGLSGGFFGIASSSAMYSPISTATTSPVSTIPSPASTISSPTYSPSLSRLSPS